MLKNIISVVENVLGVFLLFGRNCFFFFFLNDEKLIFKLFKNIKKIKLRIDSVFSYVFFWMMRFRLFFLIISFMMIFVMIIGMLSLNWCRRSGVKKVMIRMMIKDVIDVCFISKYFFKIRVIKVCLMWIKFYFFKNIMYILIRLIVKKKW